MKDKVRGAIVGVAIGDALGMPVEGLLPETIKKLYGHINSYRKPKSKIHPTLNRGQYTDDTQLTIAIAESIIDRKEIDFEDIAVRHIEAYQGERRGWGKATRESCQRLEDGTNWWVSGESGAAGNGPPMKIAPIGVLYGLGLIDKMEMVGSCINISKMTHEDPRAAIAAICQAYLVGTALKGGIETVMWELEYIGGFAGEIELVFETDETFSRNLNKAINISLEGTDEELREEIGVGSFVNMSVPFTYAMLYKYGEDLRDCMEKIVNQGGDADTTTSLAGSILGATYGYSKFPKRWRWGLEDRAKLIQIADDLYALKE